MSLREGLILTAMVLAVSDFSGAASNVLAAQKPAPATGATQTGAGGTGTDSKTGTGSKNGKKDAPRAGRPQCSEGYKMVGGRCLRQPKSAPASCPTGTVPQGGKCVTP